MTDKTDAWAESTKKSMKISAMLSVGVQGKAGGEVGVSNTWGTSTDKAKTNNEYNNSLLWQANGGNTLLCNKYVPV